MKSPPAQSNSWFTSAGKAVPAPTTPCRYRPASPIASGILHPLVDRVRQFSTRACLTHKSSIDSIKKGWSVPLGKPFTLSMIRWIRHRYKIPAAKLMSSEELTVQQVAERFRVIVYAVYSSIKQGLLPARRLNPGMPYWITVREAEEQKLRDWLSNSHRLRTTSLKRD